MDFRPLMMRKNAVINTLQNAPPSRTKAVVGSLNREIRELITQCWRQSGENYRNFEDLFYQVIDTVETKVEDMEDALADAREAALARERPQQGGYGGYGGGNYYDNRSVQQHLHYHEAPRVDHRHQDRFLRTMNVGGVLRDIYEGPRGGRYYISNTGEKRYLKA
eukprot:Skav224989  [mRNA]  locus=scaffold560:299712:300338:- [translate_table: standard]